MAYRGVIVRSRLFPGSPFPFIIGGKPFQIADGHWFPVFPENTPGFALDLLGADPAANSGQTVSPPQIPDGAGKIGIFDM